MSVLDFIQKYFVFLLPGLIGILLYNKVSIHKEEHYYFEFLKMILYSFASFLFSDAIFWIIKRFFPCFVYHPINIINFLSSSKTNLPVANTIVAILFSILFSCLLTKANYNNWIFNIANKLKLTRRIDNESVWEHLFDTTVVVVLRDFVTENTYYGSVESYSDNSINREILFNDVYVFDKYSQYLYHAESLYLSRNHNEFTIEIQNEEENINE